ncbi:MAG: hypothetical protein INR71_09950 [Terriglobus roseus]|nr:hypothetical protein [Terriglobus roseus]
MIFTAAKMLIEEFHKDVPTNAGNDMRIFLFKPTVAGYPHAKFPGVVVFSEIYQGMSVSFISSI